MNKWTAGLYRQSLVKRQQLVGDHQHLTPKQKCWMQTHATEQQNEMIENYVMNYAVPEGVAVDLTVNGRNYVVPMATEEPSVVAAACNAAKRISANGGFTAPRQVRMVRGQVVLTGIDDDTQFEQWVTEHRATILKVANDARPSMKQRGAGAKDVQVRSVAEFISVDVLVDVDQAMGANSVNTMAEAVGHYLDQQGFQVLTAILSNYATDALQKVTCCVNFDQLATKQLSGKQVAQRIAQLSRLAQVDPLRAVTHNKGIMNGIDAVVLASGNDWRAVEAGAHAYAARDGQYRGLSQWQVTADGLTGTLTLPLAVGVVGGSIKLTTQSKINYQISQIQSAEELSAVVASVGLAQNLAALRALATNGIQAGHMKLQYRSLALSVGANPTEVSPLVERLAKQPTVNTTVAQQLLAELRKEEDNAGKI